MVEGRAALVNEAEYLIKLCGEEIQGREYGTVGPQVVLLHDLFVVDGVTDVNVGAKR